MLFKDIATFKEVFPIVGSTEFENIQQFIQQAELEFIIPLIGKEQYDDINDAYNATTPTLSSEQAALLPYLQKALAPYSMYLWIPSGQLSIGDNGIRIANTETHKTAFQWQIDKLERSLIRQGGVAADSLLQFLEENKSDYTLWTDSESYNDFKSTFITSALQFSKIYAALGYSRTNFIAIRSTMKMIEDLDIQSELGEEYYLELQDEHLSGSLTEENKKVYNIMIKAIAHLTIARAIATLSVSFDERGVLNFNSKSNTTTLDNKEPAKDQMITKLEVEAEKIGKSYIQKLKKFLADNISDYSTYASSSAYDDQSTASFYKNSESDTNYGML